MKFKIIPTLIFFCLLPALLSLGVWQLNRSEQKRALFELQAKAGATEIIHLSTSIANNNPELRYKTAEVAGRYDIEHQFLLDNQINEGKAGYFVLTPLVLKGEQKAVLVNRGWVPLNPNRSVLPELQINTVETAISGRINQFPSVGIKLAGTEIPTDGWPSIVQVVDTTVLADKLGYPLFQFQLELDNNLPDGFKREWKKSSLMPPEQHMAYAIQWFALALTLTILFIWYSFKNNDAKSKE